MLAWPEETIYEGIEHVTAHQPTEPAIVFEDAVWTYERLLEESRTLAAGLADLGISSGDVIAVWLGNRPEWIVCQLAASALGAAVVAVNTRYRTHELEYMLADSNASVLVTERSLLGRDYHEMLTEAVPSIADSTPDAFEAEAFPVLETVVSLEPDDTVPAARAYDDLLEVAPDDSDLEPAAESGLEPAAESGLEPASDPTEPVAIFYTSGTTSDPKGCLQSSRSLLNHSTHVADHLGMDASDVGVATLPFCGIWGYNVLLSHLATGATLVVQTHFDPAESIRLIDDHDASVCFGLGVMFERMLEHEAFAPSRVEAVERGVIGFISKGYDEALFERIEETFGFPVVQPYGLSEGNSQIFVGEPSDPIERRKRVGGPPIHPDIEGKIVDPEGREPLSAGEEGELALRGYMLAEGYHEKPDETAAAYDDAGWFYTGDLCTMDEAGYVYYRSRLDDAMRTRGFLVGPREIQATVEDHPDVASCEIVGAPHPRHGEVPVAFVIPAADDPSADTPSIDDLEAFLDERVADYKVPAAFEVVDEFPTTEGPNGEKVQKNVLRERVADRF